MANKSQKQGAIFQKKVYEAKKARDILDEEFVEFGLTKRNINEFFNIYISNFYNISKPVHKFFSEKREKPNVEKGS